MKTITIKVTKTDIKKGSKNMPFRCPIALAAKRAGLVRPGITGWLMAVGIAQQLPSQARTFITDFDSGKEVKPFSFNVVL